MNNLASMVILSIVLIPVFGAKGAVAADTHVAFASLPTVTADGAGVRIDFEAAQSTDVVVDVIDAKGKVIRHLAAGLLGPHAPAPLAADSLQQTLNWDRTDDEGKPVRGPVRVRVGLGMQAKFKSEYGGGRQPMPELPWNGRDMDRLSAFCSGPDGTIYMLGGFFHPHLDRFPHLIALDHEGNYQREVYPPPAKLVAEGKCPGLGAIKLADGQVIPQVGSWWDLFVPAMTEAARMIATPDGHLLLATTAKDYVESRRVLLKLGADGSVPADATALRLPPGMAREVFSMAPSPDSKLLYVSGTQTTRPAKVLHVVYRLKLDGSNEHSVLFGEQTVSGGDDKHLKDPAGVATDAAGNVYVCDFGNSRVVVVKPDGTLLRKIPVDKPLDIRVHPGNGAVYVLCGNWNTPRYMHHLVPRQLVKFSAEGKRLGQVDASAKLEFGYGPIDMRLSGMGLMAGQRGDAEIWIGGTSYPDGCNGYPFGYSYGVTRIVDTGESLGEASTANMSEKVFAARRGKGRPTGIKGVQQRDGYRYGFIMRAPGDPSVVWMTRYDAKGKEAPFAAAGDDKWVQMLGRRSARHWFHCTVNYQGDILAQYYNYATRGNQELQWRSTACVDLIGPDGTVKKRELVYGLREGTYGLKVDRQGNIYVADHLPPLGRKAPAEIEKAFADADQEVPATYVTSYGSVFKIPPDGGGFVWGKAPEGAETPAEDVVRKPRVVWEPGHNSKMKATCENVTWQFFGGSPLPGTYGRCICTGIAFDVDDHARVFVPDAYRMCVHVLDANGNVIARIGGYGNQDDARDGRLAFARPRSVSVIDGDITIADPQNGRTVTVALAASAEHTVEVPSQE